MQNSNQNTFFECLYKPGQYLSSPLLKPLRIANKEPKKRELQAYVHIYRNRLHKTGGLVGLFSPKFEFKTKRSFEALHNFCNAHHAADVLLINPFPQIKYWASNAWMQGDLIHPGLLQTAQDLLSAASIDLDLNIHDRHSDKYLCFCNFWVAQEWVWDSFVGNLLVKLNDFVDSNPKNSAVRAAYVKTIYATEACFLPFIIERLFGSWLYVNRTRLKIFSFTPTLSQIKTLYCFNDFERSLVQKTQNWVDALDASDRPLTPDEYKMLHQACHEYAVFTQDYYSKHPHPLD